MKTSNMFIFLLDRWLFITTRFNMSAFSVGFYTQLVKHKEWIPVWCHCWYELVFGSYPDFFSHSPLWIFLSPVILQTRRRPSLITTADSCHPLCSVHTGKCDLGITIDKCIYCFLRDSLIEIFSKRSYERLNSHVEFFSSHFFFYEWCVIT